MRPLGVVAVLTDKERASVWPGTAEVAFPVKTERSVVQRECTVGRRDHRAIRLDRKLGIRDAALHAAWITEIVAVVKLDELLGSADGFPSVAAQLDGITRAP